MKKMITMVMMFVAVLTMCSYTETHYNREGSVVSKVGNMITVEDSTGNLWDCETDEFEKYDKVTLKMYTNGTDNDIYDDVILKVVKRS